MAAPVIVASPAGAATPECPIIFLANEPVVTATPALPWLPAPAFPGGGPPRVSLDTYQALRAFTTRSSISRVPADLAAARAVSSLAVRLHDAAWSRLLTELTASGLFAVAGAYKILTELDDAMRDAAIANPANLVLIAGDWRPAQAFAIPAGAGAAAAAQRAALQPLRFLSLVSVDRLEDQGHATPLLPLALLAGALGPCLNQAVRLQETSTVQLAAGSIRAAVADGAPNPTDGALAVRVKSIVMDNRIPTALRAHEPTEDALRIEFEDGIEYRRSADRRKTVESRRAALLDNG